MSKVAVITGAARGIGLATTKQFLAKGWSVALVDWDAAELDTVLPELGEQAAGFACDVSDAEAVQAMVAAVEARFGGIDAVVNNAGVAEFGPIEDCDYATWKRVMATNLDGPFLVTRAATPALKARRGAIVNIASISGLRASTLRVAYGTSKAAVMHLTKQHAAELGEYGIRANCVCPGPVKTEVVPPFRTVLQLF